jgi:hypothetical protein
MLVRFRNLQRMDWMRGDRSRQGERRGLLFANETVS